MTKREKAGGTKNVPPAFLQGGAAVLRAAAPFSLHIQAVPAAKLLLRTGAPDVLLHIMDGGGIPVFPVDPPAVPV